MGVPDAVVMAVLDEPPFCWLTASGAAAGCDVELAAVVLRRAGVRSVAFRQVTFAELIPGLLAGEWQLNTGMFVTEARRRLVRFTRPIWSLPDGLIVQRDDVARFGSYRRLALDPAARLGVVVGQVQGESARRAGVPEERLVQYATQDDAVEGVRGGEVDATASTAIGNRALLARMDAPGLCAVDLDDAPAAHGAFSLSPVHAALADAVDAQLDAVIGGPEHRAIVTRHFDRP
jgi:polar amino acid transport system substrate-binding protein